MLLLSTSTLLALYILSLVHRLPFAHISHLHTTNLAPKLFARQPTSPEVCKPPESSERLDGTTDGPTRTTRSERSESSTRLRPPVVAPTPRVSSSRRCVRLWMIGRSACGRWEAGRTRGERGRWTKKIFGLGCTSRRRLRLAPGSRTPSGNCPWRKMAPGGAGETCSGHGGIIRTALTHRSVSRPSS